MQRTDQIQAEVVVSRPSWEETSSHTFPLLETSVSSYCFNRVYPVYVVHTFFSHWTNCCSALFCFSLLFLIWQGSFYLFFFFWWLWAPPYCYNWELQFLTPQKWGCSYSGVIVPPLCIPSKGTGMEWTVVSELPQPYPHLADKTSLFCLTWWRSELTMQNAVIEECP